MWLTRRRKKGRSTCWHAVFAQLQMSSAPRRRVSDSDLVDIGDDSFPPEPPDLLTETDLFGGLSLGPPQTRQSFPGKISLLPACLHAKL